RLLSRRLNAEPTGYIVGAVELLELRFKVDRRGFIPRLDLPVLINAGLERVPGDVSGFALDLACGIGAAGICVAHARPGLRRELPEWLAPGGVYAQECDPSQVDKVIGLLTRAGLRDPRAHPDKEGVRRVVSAQRYG